MMDYAKPSIDGVASSVRRPAVQANTFEIKSAVIQVIQSSIQFGRLSNENPNAHISNFIEICDTFKYNGVSEDAIWLRLFPFSLRDKAKYWLNSLPAESITSWDAMAQSFLAKYFFPSKTAKLRNDFFAFTQHEIESLYETWKRYKDMFRRCPHHRLPLWLQVQTFYNNISPSKG